MRYFIKKLILISAVVCWFAHPCFAEATSHHAATKHRSGHTLKNARVHTQKRAHGSARHQVATNKNSQRKKRARKPAPIPNVPVARKENTGTQEPKLHLSFLSSIETRVIDFVHRTVNTLRYSAYKLGGTQFDSSRGIYVLDCSDYVDHILEAVYPDAFVDLVNSSGTEKPTSQHYYNFFKQLAEGDTDYWNNVHDVEHLQPGDILVFRYKDSYRGPHGGHVMVVMDKPTRDEDTFMVRVTDSARIGHSEDTRPGRVSGIGIGTMLFKVNPATGKPMAYAWRVGSRWQGNVNIAMARPKYPHGFQKFS